MTGVQTCALPICRPSDLDWRCRKCVPLLICVPFVLCHDDERHSVAWGLHLKTKTSGSGWGLVFRFCQGRFIKGHGLEGDEVSSVCIANSARKGIHTRHKEAALNRRVAGFVETPRDPWKAAPSNLQLILFDGQETSASC